MLKEVGASGQISLGKKYAGQLFDLQTEVDGTIVMRPMKLVPAAAPTVQEEPARYAAAPNAPTGAPAGAPTGTTTAQWAEQHAEQIAQYNRWAAEREPYSQRVRRWRSEGV